ncbi:MAG: hypothetical protein Q9227_002951 [Pyrenula ochraceoflavens]
MPFTGRTPEALLPRSDSKNPATTCKGITSNGRPCRRGLASSPRASPRTSPEPPSRSGAGVLAVIHDEEDSNENAAVFYCWQHKDQATQLTGDGRSTTEIMPLQERTSLDTLVERVGVLEVDDTAVGRKSGKRRKQSEAAVKKRDTLPSSWQDIPGPLMRVPEDVIHHDRSDRRPKPAMQRPPRRTRHINIFCCTKVLDDEVTHPPRRRPDQTAGNRPVASQTRRPAQNTGSRPVSGLPVNTSPSARRDGQMSEIHRRPVPNTPKRSSFASAQTPTPQRNSVSTPTRPGLTATPNSSHSQTEALLSLIPGSLPPQTASLLLSELTKPISSADEEGFIYMFWLTPEDGQSKPPDEDAGSLLAPPTVPRQSRRSSDVLQRYGSISHRSKEKTVLLKIGRAANVHRRLSQWTKQCSHDLTLIRYYPYVASESSGSLQAPRKVPHVHRVERLIHIELAEMRVKDQGACQNCGREHREWFEISARATSLKGVDETIRRWISWAERQERL